MTTTYHDQLIRSPAVLCNALSKWASKRPFWSTLKPHFTATHHYPPVLSTHLAAPEPGQWSCWVNFPMIRMLLKHGPCNFMVSQFFTKVPTDFTWKIKHLQTFSITACQSHVPCHGIEPLPTARFNPKPYPMACTNGGSFKASPEIRKCPAAQHPGSGSDDLGNRQNTKWIKMKKSPACHWVDPNPTSLVPGAPTIATPWAFRKEHGWLCD